MRRFLLAALLLLAPPASGAELVTLRSAGGVLEATLEARAAPVTLGKVTIPGEVYNGTYAGPVLRVSPGDRMHIKLVNRLDAPTNLHFHGIEASPAGMSDNIMLSVPPGESLTYDVRIPAGQPPGLYWYHAHVHGISERQVMGGLSGAIVVEGMQRMVPALAGLREQVLVLKDFEFDDSDDPVINDELHGIVQTVNGEVFQAITMQPGETQLWRVGNHSPNLYFHLALPGHRFRVIAEDGVMRAHELVVDTLDLKPAARVDVLVDAGEAGSYALVSQRVLTGAARERRLGTVTVAGPPGRGVPGPLALTGPADLRGHVIDRRRTFVFSQDADGQRYLIDGREYDHDRVDVKVPLGSVEEWTILNDSDDVHSFHIHQMHFQVVAINGEAQPLEALADTVRIPERGSITLLMPFTNPEMVGHFVFHCHVLRHEDRGMMANIEVTDPHAGLRSDMLRRLGALGRWSAYAVFALRNGMPLSWCGI